MPGAGRPRVVVVGAGFGGLWATRSLAGASAEVLLIDRNNYHTFYPLLYRIGAAELNATEIAHPVRKTLRGQENARFLMAEVEGLDLDGRRVRADGTEFAYDHLVLATETVVWTGGIRGDPDADRWGLPTTDAGRVEVRDDLSVPGHPEVQLVGDLAGFRQDGELLPMIAPAAIQQGEHGARKLRRRLEGRPAEAFRFDDPGMLAVIGRNHGVAHVFGRAFTGVLAWLLWLAVHLVELIGFRNRLVVLLNWAWDYVSYERFVRLILPLVPDRGPRSP